MTTTGRGILDRRAAGACLHITALPSDYGIGDLGVGARNFIDALTDMNLSVWQFLPIGPTGFGDSPYQPLSVFAGNEMLIEIANLIRFGLVTSTESDALLRLPRDAVDFGELVPMKKAMLNRAAGRFRTHARAKTLEDYDAFLETHDDAWLHDYALFRVLKERHGDRPWPEWAPGFAHREPAALKRVEDESGKEIEYLKIIQFIFYRQWQRLRNHAAENGVSLMGDMPIYIALDSADAWARRGIVDIDEDGNPAAVAGVPPDAFTEDGQLWGNPLYAWDYHAKTGYEWWISRFRHALAQADFVRIDHFRGLEAYWAVPTDQDSARHGEWRKGPGDEFLRAIRDGLRELPVVAEDLGYVTTEVDELRERYEIPGMRVLQFDLADPAFDAERIEENCVCYTGTHDNDTTLGWFDGSPDDLRSEEEILRTQELTLAATDGTPETIHADVVRLALSTKANLAVAPLQDFLGLGSDARFNVPGTVGDNWRWRVDAELLTPILKSNVAAMVDDTGRA